MDDLSLSAWLRERESTDEISRSALLTRTLASELESHQPLRVVDLATGTGSNIRYLMPRLGGRQQWLAVDRSSVLLEELPRRLGEWALRRGYQVERGDPYRIRGSGMESQVRTRMLNLNAIPEADALGAPHLVTASALLDLVSESWLRALAARCRELRASALFTITYNGRSSCTPAEPEDELVLQLFNRHQRTDKGLGGPAAGPDAVRAAIRSFEAEGYVVRREASDWNLGPERDAMQRILIDGWAQAASEMDPAAAVDIESWRVRRLRHVTEGRSHLVVGHDDLAALHPGG